MELDIKQVQQIMYRYIKRSKPLFLHGAPGIGKSDTVRHVCKRIANEKKLKFSESIKTNKNTFNLIDIRISQIDPSDLRGIPFPEGDTTRWLIPSWLPRSGQGVIFFDEINLAPPSIQASCYQLILDRRIGEYELPEGWTILAAGNRAIDMANTFVMAAPLKNRFSHATLMTPSSEDWIKWAIENNISNDVIAFIAFKPSLLFKFDKSSKSDAFPTPRSWASASHMLEGVKDLQEIGILVSTCVGEGSAHEFESFIKLKKKINLNDLLKNPKKVQDITASDLKFSLVSGLAEKYKGDNKLMNKILKVVEYMDPEFGVFLLRLMKGYNQGKFTGDIMNSDNWSKLFKKFGKYIF